MSFIESIGERYLWIDQICILQDNKEDKAYQISIMDRIYTEAIFTIIAADGNVHSTGLSGFRPKSRNYDPVIGTIDNVDLIQAEPTIKLDFYDSPLGTSTWNERAWTYQEFLLSSRIFVFAGGCVYYQCARGVIGEAEPGRNLGQFYTIPGGLEKYDREPFARYGALVRRYKKRILTHPSDILNAFTGLMSDFSLKIGTGFCYGLPKKYIYFGLMWKTVTVNNSEKKRRDGFPSWSWAGRFNAVEYDMNLAFRSLDVHIEWQRPEIDWDTIQRTGALRFRTRSVVLNGLYSKPCLDDGKEWEEGPRECLMIAKTDSYDSPEALLVVKEFSPGIYDREGFAEANTSFLDMYKPTVKQITLI